MGRPPVHGQCGTPTYISWRAMLNRCRNPNADQYPRYGGRGITVCDRWASDFSAFLSDMGARPSPDLTIERVNNDGNYEPGNCRWATAQEQENNKSTNRIVMYRGQSMTAAQAWRAAGQVISRSTMKSRLCLGWPIEKAVETPAVMGRNQWR